MTSYRSSLTQDTFIISPFFLGQKLRHSLAGYLCLTVFDEPAVRCQPRLGFHLKVQLGKDLLVTFVTLLLARFSSLRAIGPRPSFPCWLLAGSHPRSCHMGLSNMAFYFVKANKREVCLQNKSDFFFFATFPQRCPILSFRSKLFKRRGLYKTVEATYHS